MGFCLSIGTDAFKTGSKYLTFHGDIHSGYAPFELAMSNSKFNSTSGMNICYKTDAPAHLTVVRDNKTGYSTLIDYPHYSEVNLLNKDTIKNIIQADGYHGPDADKYKITDKFEELNGWKTTNEYSGMSLTAEENDIITATYKLNLPNGIQSVNVRDFLKNTDPRSL